MTSLDGLPTFASLPIRAGAPEHSSWGVFGSDDQLGTINLLTPAGVARAASLVRKGTVFNLDLPVLFDGPFRPQPKHRYLVRPGGISRDDLLDEFNTQATSQWDGLTHRKHPLHGFYNGVQEEQVTGLPGTRNGIEHWARHGIVGRGLLLDVARHLERCGTPLDPTSSFAIDAALLERVRVDQAVEIDFGDILLVRTGWLHYYQQLDEATRATLKGPGNLRSPGLIADDSMAEYLWDHHVAAVAVDNPAVEVSPFMRPRGEELHTSLIPLLGLCIGELFDLDELAADCDQDHAYDMMFVSSPLYVEGGVGSPPNATAIK